MAGIRQHDEIRKQVDRRIENYFLSLELPEKATLYDRIVLSLKQGDAIFTFNWDPFLFDAYTRNFCLGCCAPQKVDPALIIRFRACAPQKVWPVCANLLNVRRVSSVLRELSSYFLLVTLVVLFFIVCLRSVRVPSLIFVWMRGAPISWTTS